jgi:hypothetical protein
MIAKKARNTAPIVFGRAFESPKAIAAFFATAFWGAPISGIPLSSLIVEVVVYRERVYWIQSLIR